MAPTPALTVTAMVSEASGADAGVSGSGAAEWVWAERREVSGEGLLPGPVVTLSETGFRISVHINSFPAGDGKNARGTGHKGSGFAVDAISPFNLP